MNPIIERIEREAGIPGLATLLAERLSPTDLQSLLLETYRQRAGRREPRQVLEEYETSRFAHPATVSPQRLIAWESLAWSLLPEGFTGIALSPVAPLGTCSVVATVDQNKAVATIRNSEVVSDSTNVLALECALRRRQLLKDDPKSTEPVHLAASHRLLRPQFSTNKGMLAHFTLFGLTSAGRDQGTLRFEIAALQAHIRFYLTAIMAFLGEGTRFEVAVTDFAPEPRWDLIEADLLTPLRAAFGMTASFSFAPERETGRGYYRDVCFHLYVTTPAGERLFIGDGGSVDWTAKYLSNTKERLITSGIGSERLCSVPEEGKG